jgi:hypothetical protein
VFALKALAVGCSTACSVPVVVAIVVVIQAAASVRLLLLVVLRHHVVVALRLHRLVEHLRQIAVLRPLLHVALQLQVVVLVPRLLAVALLQHADVTLNQHVALLLHADVTPDVTPDVAADASEAEACWPSCSPVDARSPAADVIPSQLVALLPHVDVAQSRRAVLLLHADATPVAAVEAYWPSYSVAAA